jgi:cytidylate kinase
MGLSHSSEIQSSIATEEEEYNDILRLLEDREGVDYLALLQQLRDEMQDEQQAEATTNSGPPRASEKAMSELPCYRLATTPDAPGGRSECCLVCYEEQTVGCTITCLPCGHYFHSACVHEWLRRRCTCPVCRYELATDDPRYEQERAQRMKQRTTSSTSTSTTISSSGSSNTSSNNLTLSAANSTNTLKRMGPQDEIRAAMQQQQQHSSSRSCAAADGGGAGTTSTSKDDLRVLLSSRSSRATSTSTSQLSSFLKSRSDYYYWPSSMIFDPEDACGWD